MSRVGKMEICENLGKVRFLTIFFAPKYIENRGTVLGIRYMSCFSFNKITCLEREVL
jgi:hypothetical protein